MVCNGWGASGGANTSGAQTTLGTVTTASPLTSAPSSCTINPNPTPTPTLTLTPSNTPTRTFTPTDTLSPTPTPSPTPTVPICEGFSLLEEEECPPTLGDFGIVLEGEPGDWPLGWRSAILQGAIETGTALYAHGVTADSLVEAFRIVMEGMNGGNFREIHFKRVSLSGTYCITTPNPDAATSALIECDTDVDLTQYTVVHEFGHVFVGRTGGDVTGTNTFYGRVEAPGGPGTALETASDILVIGPATINILSGSIDDWQRSDFVEDNGWGSAAQWVPTAYHEYPVPDLPTVAPSSAPATGYPVRIPNIGPCGPNAPSNLPPVLDAPFPMQQNPCTFSDEDALNGNSLIEEIEEAAADMFLNWVYWKNYGPPPLVPTGTPTPSGFGDIIWRYDRDGGETCYPNGCNDPDGSGQLRHMWMDNTMTYLFTLYGW